MKVAQLKNGTPVTLTPTGKGGAESEIFRLSTGVLAAIPNEEMTAERVSVVEALAAMPPIPCAALPTELLYDRGKPIGWLMPEINGEPLEVFFLPAERNRLGLDFDSQRFEVAKKIVKIFQAVLKSEIAIVDNHPGNFILSTSRGNITAITRIDVAAGCGMTVNHRPIPASAACMPDYLPQEAVPEFRSGAIHTWGEDQAAGALACLLFKVFTGGSTLDHGEPGDPATLIAAGKLSIFGVEPNSEVRRQFDSLPPVIRSYLEQAITGPAGRRPTLAMWEVALGMAPTPKRTLINWMGLGRGLSARFIYAGRSASRRKFALLTVCSAVTLAVMIFQSSPNFRWTLSAIPTERASFGFVSTQQSTEAQVVPQKALVTAGKLWISPEPVLNKLTSYTPKVTKKLWRDSK